MNPTSSSTSNPPVLSTILTKQGVEDHTGHKTTPTVHRKINDNTATTTRSIGKNREISYIYEVCTWK